jgi:hypothetical protein
MSGRGGHNIIPLQMPNSTTQALLVVCYLQREEGRVLGVYKREVG